VHNLASEIVDSKLGKQVLQGILILSFSSWLLYG